MQGIAEAPNGQTAMVSNIQRCSVHDGPGIRTTIFLKGCNMHCQWCHNPETISFAPEYLLYPEKCIGCNMCEHGCFAGARVLCGKEMTVDEIATEALLDKAYYAEDGGVTISGGEPTCQWQATLAILQRLQAEGVHTAIETNLLCTTEVLEALCPHCDLIMCDCKLFEADKHKTYTGVGNEQILANISYLLSRGMPLIIRTPVMAGVNDSEAEIASITQFLASQTGSEAILYYELLPYHSLGLSKESENNQHITFAAPSKAQLAALVAVAKKSIPTVYLAGVKA